MAVHSGMCNVLTYLQRRIQRQVGVQQVLWLQVTMNNPVTVQILKHTDKHGGEPSLKTDPPKIYLEQRQEHDGRGD